MNRLEEMEKRLQYLEGKEAEREAGKQKWIDYGNKRAAELNHADGSIVSKRIADGAITSATIADCSITPERLGMSRTRL